MSIALYRRFRPEAFNEVIGQEQVTVPLMAALRAGKVNHAYLFSGPRGCGKTTSARILARTLNCAANTPEHPLDTPCGECESCVELSRLGSGSLDVVEIDAASHGGVDAARDLRERTTYTPSRDRYKIFIIDEAHMVTKEGFNALLKVVEEPPPHIKFIFATTEPEKVLGTIRSRTHHYPFRLVPSEVLAPYLEQLSTEEGATLGSGVVPLVIRAGGGSVRDSLSVLDQLIAGSIDGVVTYDRAVSLLGYTPLAMLDEAVLALAQNDGAALFQVVERVINNGSPPNRFAEDLLQRFRDLIVVSVTGDGAGSVFRDWTEDELEAARTLASQFDLGALTRLGETISAGLGSMVGATSPRLQLELLCARLLVPVGPEQLAARISNLEHSLATGQIPIVSAPGGTGMPKPVTSANPAGRPGTSVATGSVPSVPAANAAAGQVPVVAAPTRSAGNSSPATPGQPVSPPAATSARARAAALIAAETQPTAEPAPASSPVNVPAVTPVDTSPSRAAGPPSPATASPRPASVQPVSQVAVPERPAAAMAPQPEPKPAPIAPQPAAADVPRAVSKDQGSTSPKADELSRLKSDWDQLVSDIPSPVTRSLLNSSSGPVAVEPDLVSIGFTYQTHADRLADPRQMDAMSHVLSAYLGRQVRVRGVVAPSGDGETGVPAARSTVTHRGTGEPGGNSTARNNSNNRISTRESGSAMPSGAESARTSADTPESARPRSHPRPAPIADESWREADAAWLAGEAIPLKVPAADPEPQQNQPAPSKAVADSGSTSRSVPVEPAPGSVPGGVEPNNSGDRLSAEASVVPPVQGSPARNGDGGDGANTESDDSPPFNDFEPDDLEDLPDLAEPVTVTPRLAAKSQVAAEKAGSAASSSGNGGTRAHPVRTAATEDEADPDDEVADQTFLSGVPLVVDMLSGTVISEEPL